MMSSVNVGERIRQLRLSQGMSLRTLATKSGFSPSLISQVETGQVTPSIGSLEQIAKTLGLTLGKFFAEAETNPAMLVRATGRQKITSTWSPVSIEALGPVDGLRKLESIMLTMAPNGRSGTYPTVHAGERFAMVIEGEVTLMLGTETHLLGRGDAITFTSAAPHQWVNAGSAPAQVVIVATRQQH